MIRSELVFKALNGIRKGLQAGILTAPFFLSLSCATHQDSSETLNERASIQYQFAYEAYIRGELIPALASALESVKAAPKNADAKNLLGLIYFRQSKYKEAEDSFIEASKLDPKLSEVYNNLGTLYYERGNYEKALVTLQKALDNPLYLYPERIYNNIGLVQTALGHFEDAKEAYKRSISLKQDFYLPYQNMGKALVKNGVEDEAKGYFVRATKLCEECSEPRYHLGKILLKENRKTEALQVFKQGAKIDPNGYYGQLCQQNLESPNTSN